MNDDHDFKLGMLLSSSVLEEQVDQETTKLSNEQFEVFLKNHRVVLVIDKRDATITRMYNDVDTAYEKVFGTSFWEHVLHNFGKMNYFYTSHCSCHFFLTHTVRD